MVLVLPSEKRKSWSSPTPTVGACRGLSTPQQEEEEEAAAAFPEAHFVRPFYLGGGLPVLYYYCWKRQRREMRWMGGTVYMEAAGPHTINDGRTWCTTSAVSPSRSFISQEQAGLGCDSMMRRSLICLPQVLPSMLTWVNSEDLIII